MQEMAGRTGFKVMITSHLRRADNISLDDNAFGDVGSLGVEHYGNGEIKKAKKLHLGISFYTKRGFLHHRRKDETIL